MTLREAPDPACCSRLKKVQTKLGYEGQSSGSRRERESQTEG